MHAFGISHTPYDPEIASLFILQIKVENHQFYINRRFQDGLGKFDESDNSDIKFRLENCSVDKRHQVVSGNDETTELRLRLQKEFSFGITPSPRGMVILSLYVSKSVATNATICNSDTSRDWRLSHERWTFYRVRT